MPPTDKTIAQLANAALLSSVDQVPVFQGGETVAATMAQIAAFTGGGGGGGGPLPPSCTAYIGGAFYITGGSKNAIYTASFGDAASCWDVANPTRLTVPAGTTKVRLIVQTRYPYQTYQGMIQNYIIPSAGFANNLPINVAQNINGMGSQLCSNLVTSVISCNPADYFEVNYFASRSSLYTINDPHWNWFSMELLN